MRGTWRGTTRLRHGDPGKWARPSARARERGARKHGRASMTVRESTGQCNECAALHDQVCAALHGSMPGARKRHDGWREGWYGNGARAFPCKHSGQRT
eukprot:4123476-Prymnesium_polylepis.1